MNLYREYRCKHCEKLLFKGLLIESEVEIKCKACHLFSVFKGDSANEYMCVIQDCPNRIRIGNSPVSTGTS